MDLRNFFYDTLANSLTADAEEVLLNGFDAERGADTRFNERGDILAFAHGVCCDFPHNPIHGNAKVWDAVERAVDMTCEYMHDDGCWTWYVPATKKCHHSPRPFGYMEWLRTYEAFGDHMDAARQTRFEQMLRTSLAYRMEIVQRARDDLSKRNIGLNILAHVAVQLWYGGRLFGEAAWVDAGAAVLDRIVAIQTPDGWWPDKAIPRGPANLYNTVTLEAVASYAWHSGNSVARAAVQRAANYHLHMAYPDGTFVETVDERNRHRTGLGCWRLIVSLARFEETRPVAAYFAERMADAQRKEPDLRQPQLAGGFCEALDAIPEGDVAPVGNETFQARFGNIPAWVERRAPWQLCLSGGTTDQPGSMFHYDLQNHISLWHDSAGLIVGGGNSLYDPLCSTFRFGSHYLADSGSVSYEGKSSIVELNYGSIRATLAITLESDSEVSMEVATQGVLPPDSDFAIHLPRLFGGLVQTQDEATPLDDRSVYRGAGGDQGSLAIGGININSDHEFIVMWPILPVNIYNVPMHLPLEEAVVRISVRLDAHPVKLRLTINP